GSGDEGSGRTPDEQSPTRHPGFSWTLVTILTPVVLMLLRAAADVWMSEDAWIYPFVRFIGAPVVALLLALLLAFATFGRNVGFCAASLTQPCGGRVDRYR